METTKIKRYDHDWHTPGSDGPSAFGELVENPEGDYVLWEDVCGFVEELSSNHRVMKEQLRALMDSYIDAIKVLRQGKSNE